MTRFALDGEKSPVEHDAAYGTGNKQFQYDPDLAHPAAGYGGTRDAEELGAGISRRRLLTKIDLRLIPVLSILYLLAFLDRTNIANAQVFGLSKELKLHGDQYNIGLVVFFTSYVVFEIPSNIILKRLKPNVWLSFCMFFFGVMTICQGVTHSFGGLVATRFLLGIFEAGMFPGCFYLISMWYQRYEAQKRFTFFFASTTLAGAFGGLLASAIGKMDGIAGYAGWRWIFILEGLLTCVISFIFFFIIPNFPEDAKWLTTAEREYIKARLEEDQGKSALEKRITFRDVFKCLTDYRYIIGGLMYFGLIVPAYGYAYFAPTIIKTYGYSPIETQLHSVPPWAAAFGFSMLVAFFSDWLRHRFLFTILPMCIGITGFALLIRKDLSNDVHYGALFLVTSGVYSAMPVAVCWFNMNCGGHTRRAIGTAWMIGFGNIGGIISVFIFPATAAKNGFHLGYSVCLGFICLSAAACTTYFVVVSSLNRSRDKAGTDTGLTEYEKIEKGDLSPDYRYML